MSEQAGPVLHVVERLNWQKTRRLDWNRPWDDRVEWEGYVLLPGATRLRSFADAEEAGRFCAACEEEVRARANPFACGGPALHYQSSFDEGRLLDGGLDPPRPGKGGTRDWRKWWARCAGQLTPGQRAHCWQALDKVRFHQVVERPARPTVFVVTRRDWHYNDEWYFVSSEMTQPVEAFSTWEKAERERARREAETVRGFTQEDFSQGHEVTALVWARAEPFAPVADGDIFARPGEPLFFEVVEVELAG
jgi:hypothetical protein